MLPFLVTNSFARSFRCGIFFIFFVASGFHKISKWHAKNSKQSDNSTTTESQETTYFSMTNGNFLMWYWISLVLFGLTFCLKANYNLKHGRNRMPRHHNLFCMKIGIVGLTICAIVQYATCISMYWGFEAGIPIIFISHVLILLFLGIFLMEQSHWCLFTKSYSNSFFVWAFITCVICLGMNYWTENTFEDNLGNNLFMIGVLLADTYIILTDPSSIYFLKDFVGKVVICENDKGRIFRGVFKGIGNHFMEMPVRIDNTVEFVDGTEVLTGCVSIESVKSLKEVDGDEDVEKYIAGYSKRSEELHRLPSDKIKYV